MLKSKVGFIKYCEKKIKSNNSKIRMLNNEISEYETIIDVISKTDISNNIIAKYKNKIDLCMDKIENIAESNKHNNDLIKAIKITL